MKHGCNLDETYFFGTSLCDAPQQNMNSKIIFEKKLGLKLLQILVASIVKATDLF